MVAEDVPERLTVAALAPTDPEMDQVAGGLTVKVNVLEVLPAAAVRIAVCVEETVATVAVNPALDSPEATLTLLGTLTFALLLERPTENPVEEAAPVSVTVHETELGEITLADPQLRALSEGAVVVTEMVPPAPADESIVPVRLETTTPPTVIVTFESGAAEAMARFTAATVPLAIAL